MHCRRHYILFAFLLLLAGSTPALAQQKIGYVNTDTILAEIPEYGNIQQQLTIISDGWRQQLQTMQQQIDSLRQEFDSKEILYTDELRAQKKQELQALITKREQYLNNKFGPDGDYYQRQQALLEPIQRRVYEAVTTVAQRQNFDFVFDRAQNTSLLFGQTQWNLNRDVLQELGITLDN